MNKLDEMHYDANDLQAVRASGQLREDAGEALFFAKQLEYVKGQAFDVKRPPLSAMRLIPVSTDVPAGANTITYRTFDAVGAAKIIANYADDLPRAEVGGTEFTTPIRGLGISYGYSMQEIRAAQYAGTNLDAMKMAAARKGHEQSINKLAWGGDSVSGLPGFLTNPNIPAYVIPANGTGASKLWSTKTADQILADLNGMLNSVRSVTKDVHNVNQIWMTPDAYALISSMPRSGTSDTTVLDFFLRNNPGVRVESVLELKGAGAGGTDLVIALENNAENFQMEVPMMFMQHAPQYRNLEFIINCESRFGGVVIRFPLAFVLASGV